MAWSATWSVKWTVTPGCDFNCLTHIKMPLYLVLSFCLLVWHVRAVRYVWPPACDSVRCFLLSPIRVGEAPGAARPVFPGASLCLPADGSRWALSGDELGRSAATLFGLLGGLLRWHLGALFEWKASHFLAIFCCQGSGLKLTSLTSDISTYVSDTSEELCEVESYDLASKLYE